jgi:hypothetical protein
VRGVPDRCTVVLERDWQALVRELKAACVATGQADAECQADAE